MMLADFAHALTLSLLPEGILVAVAAIIAVLALLRPRQRPDLYRWIACIAIAGSGAACGLIFGAMRSIAGGVALVVWNGGFVVDRFGLYIAILACATALLSCLLSDTLLRRIPSRSGAFFALLLVATAGVEAVAAERDTITMYAALSVVATCLVAIGALVKTDSRGATAAYRHLVEGAVASSMLLYGIAILYGVTGSTGLGTVAAALPRAPAIGALGIAMVILGLCGALGVLPWRQWVGTVAASAPAGAAGFVIPMGVIAGATALARVTVSGLGEGVRPWAWLLAVVVALAVGHAALRSLRETEVSRLAGLLISAQTATLLPGVLALGSGVGAKAAAQGTTAFLVALAVAALGTVSVFAALGMLQAAGLGDRLDDLRGLSRRNPAAALLLTLALATVAGVPPLAGFLWRILVLESVVDAGYAWLAILLLAAGVVILVPVIRLIGAIYGERGDEVPFTLGATPVLPRVVAAAGCVVAVFLGVVMQPLLMLASGGAAPLR